VIRLLCLALGTLLLSACSGSRPAETPPDVLATFEGGPLTVDEFETRYAQAVGGRAAAADSSQAAYRDFLDRYVDFRLKVRAAREAGLEADSAIAADLAGYRQSFARPYLLEREVLEPIVQTIYARRDTLVSASHILVRVDPNAAPSDTLAALARMEAIVDSLQAGMDFADAARAFSEDPSARGNGPGGGGALGFFSSGALVEPFETVAYRTPVGERSPIFRTLFGYHVLHVDDRTTAPRAVDVSHILIRPGGGDPSDEAQARTLADSVRAEIVAGTLAFDEAARRFSDDPQSAERGGTLGTLTWQTQVVQPFKDAAFALDEPGDLSEPVETQFGFHLIRLDGREAQPTYDEAYEELKATAARLPRSQRAEDDLADATLAQIGSQLFPARLSGLVGSARLDSAMAQMQAGVLGSVDDSVVAVVGQASFSLADVLAFAPEADAVARNAVLDAPTADRLLTAFARDRAIAYETDRLETRDPEFGRIMQEFRDGLLLFAVMEDSVWTPAQTDTTGLRALFERASADYAFPERTRIVSITGADSLLRAYRDRLTSGTPLDAIVAEAQTLSDGEVPLARVDTVRIAEASGSIYDRALPLADGESVGPLPYRGSRVLLVKSGVEAPRPMTFDEAFAPLQARYQEERDAAFVERLRRRYDLRLFPERLDRVFAGAATPQAAPTAP
jgi:peptidyl-prolyl cis-trans isomerase SurA